MFAIAAAVHRSARCPQRGGSCAAVRPPRARLRAQAQLRARCPPCKAGPGSASSCRWRVWPTRVVAGRGSRANAFHRSRSLPPLSVAPRHRVRPNPSLKRDCHRQGTWPASRSLSSSASRAKPLPGVSPSAQTLGLHSHPPSHCAVPFVRRLNLTTRMRHLLAILALWLSACATPTPSKSDSASTIPDGLWRGDLSRFQHSRSRSETYPPAEVLISSCTGRVQIFNIEENGKYNRRMPETTDVLSVHGTHVIVTRNRSARELGWVETQIFTFIELSDEAARVQLNRSVSNRGFEISHDQRTFFEEGVGDFKRVSTSCAFTVPQ